MGQEFNALNKEAWRPGFTDKSIPCKKTHIRRSMDTRKAGDLGPRVGSGTDVEVRQVLVPTQSQVLIWNYVPNPHLIRVLGRTSLVAEWVKICLPMQGTQVPSLVWEDPTCCGATKPVHHNCWACTLEPVNHNFWAHVLQPLKPACLETVLHNKRNHHNEKSMHPNKEQPLLTVTRESPH